MPEFGADVDALEELAFTFDREARTIERLLDQIRGKVETVWWKGKDAETFRDEWDSEYRPQLMKIMHAFDHAHIRLIREAQEQRQASGG